MSLPNPVAYGIFAKIGARMILQWPPRLVLVDAQNDMRWYGPDAVLEVRPLFDGDRVPPGYLNMIGKLEAENARLRQLLANQADLVEDALRLDHLEQLANGDRGVYLHDGMPNKRTGLPGLGLKHLGRTLRQAIDHLRGIEPHHEQKDANA